MIKVTVNQAEAAQEYPCLMISEETGLVILFTSHGVGTVIVASKVMDDKLGERKARLVMSRFKPFHGTVTLENGK